MRSRAAATDAQIQNRIPLFQKFIEQRLLARAEIVERGVMLRYLGLIIDGKIRILLFPSIG
jgi:hypothetical protein